MLFNSIHFFYFLGILLPLYFITPHKFRWIVMLGASLYFYMSWNVKYLFLILFTTSVSYLSAILIDKSESSLWKKVYLISSISASLFILFYFKYYNFFVKTLNEIGGYKFNLLDYLLPVGISFYTFETFSYTFDVYNKKLKAENHFGIYALFISFFPKLVAGPIERSENLLPQFKLKQRFDFENLVIGIKLLILGFFMKLVVADRAAIYVDSVYNNVGLHNGMTLWIATFLFSFQILCDFAGYSIIAKGVAKLFGFNLMTNFQRPYLATSFSQFWRRWHISLSSWFRDYLFIPLGGSRVTVLKQYKNILITFVISGLWHGANWTFLIWGLLHGFYLIIENFEKYNFLQYERKFNIKFTIFSKRFFVFFLTSFAWIFFRANSVEDAILVIKNSFNINSTLFYDTKTFFYSLIGIIILIGINFYEESRNEINELNNETFNLKTASFFGLLLVLIFYLGVFDGGQFIYFQF